VRELSTAERAAVQPGGDVTRRSLTRRFSRGWLTYGLGSFVQRGIGFLLLPIYTTYLSPAELGIVGVVLAVFSGFSVIFGLGLRGAVTRQYFDHAEAPPRLREYLGSVYTAFALYGAVGASLLTLFGRGLFERTLPQVPFAPFMPLALWAAFCAAAGGVLLSLYRAREQAVRYVLLELVSAVLMLGFVAYFVVVRRGGAVGQAQGLFWSSLSAFALTLVLLLREARPRCNVAMIRRAVAFGAPLMVHLLAGWVLLAADRVLLARMMSLTEVGLYTLGYQIAMIMGVVASASNAAWAPMFYDVARTHADAPRSLGRLASVNLGVSFAVGLLLILFGREIVLVMGGERYAGAATVVPVIVLAYALQALYFVTVTPIFYAQQTRLLAPLTVSAAALNVGLNILLIPRFGMIGAAWGTFIAFGFLFVAAATIARRRFAVDYEVGTLVLLFGLLIVAACAMWATARTSLIMAAALKLTLVALYVGACVRTGVVSRLGGAVADE